MAKTETISQPTVIERGADGANNYCKLSDGTLMQWGLASQTPTNPRSWGGTLYLADFTAINFPVAFVSTPVVEVTPNSSSYSMWPVTIGANANSISKLQFARSTAFDNLNYVFGWFAIGRWK